MHFKDTVGGGVLVKMCLLGQKRKNVFFKTYSLQDKIKMRNVGRKQKLAQKILKITKLERSLSDEWRVQQ